MARRTKQLSTGGDTQELFRIVTAHEEEKQATGAAEGVLVDDVPRHLDTSRPAVRRAPLLPEKRGIDLFMIDPLSGVILKSDMQTLEHPIFSLSKVRDMSTYHYEHQGNWLEVTPSSIGRATIYDRDLILYITSHIVRAVNEGRAVSQTVRLTAHDFLKFANRGNGGRSYELLRESLTRLGGTRIQTNIKTNDTDEFRTFGLVESASVVRETRDGQMLDLEVKVSDWLFKAISNSEVLALHPDYFRLKRPLERRLYELARKHCGRQESWVVSLDVCLKKSGSRGELKEFRRMVREIVEANAETQHFPDYDIRLEGDYLVFELRRVSALAKPLVGEASSRPSLKSDTYEKAKRVAPGMDVYALEADWINFWHSSGRQKLKSPDAAFVNYCKSRVAPGKKPRTRARGQA